MLGASNRVFLIPTGLLTKWHDRNTFAKFPAQFEIGKRNDVKGLVENMHVTTNVRLLNSLVGLCSPVESETTLKTFAPLAHLEAGQYKNISFHRGFKQKERKGLEKKNNKKKGSGRPTTKLKPALS